MELAGRSTRDRIARAIVVFVVLAAIGYYRNTLDWSYLGAVVVSFAALVVVLDLVRGKLAA